MIRIGIIGYGARIQGVYGLLQKLKAGTELAAIADPKNEEIKSKMQNDGIDTSKIAFYSNADDMLNKEKLDAVMVGTRCSLHSKMAIKVLQKNLPMYLEKPISTNMEDLMALRDAAKKSTSEVVVSFPLRVTPLVQMAKEIIDSGQIGTVEHVQAWNNVPYGGVYFHGWYRDENETQGQWLQKATHDFDYINHLIGIKPIQICAMTSKQIYKGNHKAGLWCKDCDEWDECLESPYHIYFTKQESTEVDSLQCVHHPEGNRCGFAVDTGNEDSGSAIVQYATGMHVNYTQNFFARNKAGKRGATLLGYKGTVEFDWYTDDLKVIMHHSPRVESYKYESSAQSHGGGDTVLVDNFVKVIQGKCKSVSPISAGLLSVLICLKAKESDKTRAFQDIKYSDE